jgi:UDP-glucose 4-epimerase
MKTLVTGGAGFIGSNLVDALLEEGHEVIIIDNMSNGDQENLDQAIKKGATLVVGDIRSESLDEYFQGVDAVFHLAAMARVQPSIENPLEFDDVNVRGTLNILEHCRRNKVKRFVFSSSSSVYGEPPVRVSTGSIGFRENDPTKPMSPYGLQKLIGEQYCKLYTSLHGMECIALRYFNVYGERQSIKGAYKLVMGIFAEQRLKGEPLTIVGDGEQRRDFTYVDDVVEANMLAAESEFEGYYVFNIGHGDSRSVNQIAELFGGETVNLPARIEPKVTLAENGRARQALGWTPSTTVEEWIPGWLKELGVE